MATGSAPVAGQLIDEEQASGDALAMAEAAMLRFFLIARWGHLLVGVICSATSWRSYRRRRLVLATLGAAVAESAWLSRRCRQRGALDEGAPAWIDLAAAATGLMTIAAATTVEDRTAWANWMCPLTFTTIPAMTLGTSPQQSAAGAAVLAGTYLATAAECIRRGGNATSTVLANTFSFGGLCVVTNVVVRHLRRSAAELEQARETAIHSAQHLAAERERVRQHQLLHDSALQTFEAVAAGWGSGSDVGLHERARAEMRTLEVALTDDDHDGGLPS